MKVWRLDDDASKYRRLTSKDDINGGVFIRSFDGNSKMDNWNPPNLIFEPEDIKKPLGDSIHFLSGLFVVNSKVAALFKENFNSSVELLPIESLEGFFIANILDVTNCIDYNKSDVKYFPDSDRILRIKKFAFTKNVVEEKFIFKDNGFPVTEIFVTDQAKKIIEGWNITGINFIEIWDSDR